MGNATTQIELSANSNSDPVSNVLKWILLFTAIGWSQLMDVYEHGYAHARSLDFYNTTLVWQWLRLPGDVLFALGGLFMTYDFIRKLGPFFPNRISANTVEQKYKGRNKSISEA